MKDNSFKGKLIAIDGPNGVGKSTIIQSLKDKLKVEEYQIYITKEPTDTNIGGFTRKYAEENFGISLACLVAADRYEHINNEIIPQLKKGNLVITDRYILSSLILQRMDKVSSKFILDINAEIIKPDLQIAVFADEQILQKRLIGRDILTRFEKGEKSAYELKYLEEGERLLSEMGIKVLRIINNDNLDENIENIVANIIKL